MQFNNIKFIIAALATGAVAAHVAPAFVFATIAASAAGEAKPLHLRVALTADEGVPPNLVVALKADEGVPQNLVTA